MKKSSMRVLVILGLVCLIFAVGSGCEKKTQSVKKAGESLQGVHKPNKNMQSVKKKIASSQKKPVKRPECRKFQNRITSKDMLWDGSYWCPEFFQVESFAQKPSRLVVPLLLEFLQCVSCERARTRAVYLLGKHGHGEADQVLKQLLLIIRSDKNDNTIEAAITALGKLGTSSVPTLIKVYQGNRTHQSERGIWVQMKVAEILGKLGNQAKSALPLLYEAFRKNRFHPKGMYPDEYEGAEPKDWRVYLSAARAIAQIAPFPNEGFSALVTFLKTFGCREPFFKPKGNNCYSYGSGKAYVIKSFRVIGTKTAEVAPLLVNLLQDIRAEKRDEARRTLKAFGEKAIPALVEGLKSSDKEIRLRVIWILEGLGAKADKALPHLRRLRKSKDFRIRKAVKPAIKRILEASLSNKK